MWQAESNKYEFVLRCSYYLVLFLHIFMFHIPFVLPHIFFAESFCLKNTHISYTMEKPQIITTGMQADEAPDKPVRYLASRPLRVASHRPWSFLNSSWFRTQQIPFQKCLHLLLLTYQLRVLCKTLQSSNLMPRCLVKGIEISILKR